MHILRQPSTKGNIAFATQHVSTVGRQHGTWEKHPEIMNSGFTSFKDYINKLNYYLLHGESQLPKVTIKVNYLARCTN